VRQGEPRGVRGALSSSLNAGGLDDSYTVIVTAAAHTIWAMPWVWLAIAVLVVAIWQWRRRRWRRLRERAETAEAEATGPEPEKQPA
jgi:ABC-type uncharacterized transport system YnjBCD permease subunit